ncbi:MAG TPA: hypothetical protein VF742_16670, partial [Terracidiphilus sp.]
SNPVTVTVQDYSIVPTNPNPSNLTIVKGKSGQAQFLVSGLGGYNNKIQVVCNVLPQDDMTCTPSPVQVTPTSTITFTVQTYTTGGPSSSSAASGKIGRSNGQMWMRAGGGMALALIVVLAPIGRRARRWQSLTRLVAIMAFLAGLCGAGMGCQSTSGANGQGTPLGTTMIRITATAYIDNAVVSHSAFMTVTVIPPPS